MTKKQTAIQHYLNGCTFFGIEPDAEYKSWTLKQIEAQVKVLVKLHRSKTTVGDLAQSAKETARVVTQRLGEGRRSVMQRAKELAKSSNFPSIKVQWNK